MRVNMCTFWSYPSFVAILKITWLAFGGFGILGMRLPIDRAQQRTGFGYGDQASAVKAFDVLQRTAF